MYAKVMSDLLEHRKKVLEQLEGLVQEGWTTRLVFTGHSLGGGCALIAHLCAAHEPALQDTMAVNSIVFAAPMVFYANKDNLKCLNKGDQERLNKLKEYFAESSMNFVCDKDIVPRLPGHHEWFKPALKACARSMTKSALCTALNVTQEGRIAQACSDVTGTLCAMFGNQESFDKTLKKLGDYFHMSRVRHFNFTFARLSFEESKHGDLTDCPFSGEDDDYRLALACHTFFPEKVRLIIPR